MLDGIEATVVYLLLTSFLWAGWLCVIIRHHSRCFGNSVADDLEQTRYWLILNGKLKIKDLGLHLFVSMTCHFYKKE